MLKYLIIGIAALAVSVGFGFSYQNGATANHKTILLAPANVEQHVSNREQEIFGNEQRTIVEDSKERIITTDDKLKTLRRIKSK
tara:strand:+ start:54 stop:305 length:252 start_codon:yes stop_codon:yes gene_type:complete